MPLELRTQSIPFTQGPDLKNDQRLSAKPSKLEHGSFTTGDLNKHPGRTTLPRAIDTGGNQSSGEAIFTYNNELMRINGGVTYGLGVQQAKWTTKAGGSHYCTLEKTALIQTGASAGTFDQASINGIGVVAYQGSGGLHVTVYDVASGTTYQSGQAAIASSGLGGQPRCCVLGGTVLILWGDVSTGKIYSAIVDSTAPTTVPTATNILSDLYTSSGGFDAVTYNSQMAVLVYPTTSANMKIIGIGPTGATLASPASVTIVALTNVGGLVNEGLLVQRDSAGNIYIVYGNEDTDATEYIVRDGSFASVLTTTTIVATGNWSGTTADFRTGASVELSANNITLMLTQTANDVSCFVGTAVINATGVATAFSELPSTAGLIIQSDAVAWDSGAVFGLVNIDSNGAGFSTDTSGAQSTAWMLDTTGQVVARGLNSLAVAINDTTAKPRVARSLVDGYQVSMLFEVIARFEAIGGASIVRQGTYGLTQLIATAVAVNKLPTILVGNTEYIGGGLPRVYESQVIAEAGFATAPNLVFLVENAGGGSLLTGTYQWKLLWSWTGSNGELVRGPVSVGFSKAVTATASVTLRVNSMPLSMRDILPAGATVFVEIYRTQVNGTVFNKVTQIGVVTLPKNITTYAGLTSGGVPFTDALSDTAAAAGELLYTTGGVLEWEAPPAYDVACAHQGRMLIVPSENPYEFWASSQWVPGENVRFSSFNVTRIPSDTGPITGIASMDGKIIVLTQNAAYMTLGDGPDQLGNNQYPAVQRIVGADIGPIPGSPLAVTPMGIVYQSAKGLTLVDRALNQSFIGADVERLSLTPWTLRSVVVHARLQQIHFQVDAGSDIVGMQTGQLVPSDGGYRLVYDYYYQQWDTDPSWGAQDACLYQGNYTQVRSDGVMFQETPQAFTDNGTAYSLVVETPWIKFAGIQGFQRLYNVEVLGTYYSDCTIKMEIAYSYESTSPTLPYFDPADTVTLDGAAARIAGAEGFTPESQFVMRHHIGRKCSAIKLRISDTSILGNGRGIGLTDLSLEYGVKKGLRKLPAAQTA